MRKENKDYKKKLFFICLILLITLAVLIFTFIFLIEWAVKLPVVYSSEYYCLDQYPKTNYFMNQIGNVGCITYKVICESMNRTDKINFNINFSSSNCTRMVEIYVDSVIDDNNLTYNVISIRGQTNNIQNINKTLEIPLDIPLILGGSLPPYSEVWGYKINVNNTNFTHLYIKKIEVKNI
jgi:hypothetical protein